MKLFPLPCRCSPCSILQRSTLVFEAHSYKCNEWATLNSLKECGLELPSALNVEEFLFSEENAVD